MTSDLPLHLSPQPVSLQMQLMQLPHLLPFWAHVPNPMTLGPHGIPAALVWLHLGSVKHLDLAQTF